MAKPRRPNLKNRRRTSTTTPKPYAGSSKAQSKLLFQFAILSLIFGWLWFSNSTFKAKSTELQIA